MAETNPCQVCCQVCRKPIPRDGWGETARKTDGGFTHYACLPRMEPKPHPLGDHAASASETAASASETAASASETAASASETAASASETAETFLTIADAAQLLRVSKSTIRNYIRRGELTPYHLKNSPLIRLKKSSVLALLETV